MSSSNYKPLQVKKFAKKAISDTPENKYWKKFKVESSKTYVNAINKVYSGGNDSELIAFTEGRIVYVYNSKKEEIKQQIERFQDKVTGICFRKEGKMMATAEANGKIKIWEVSKKTLLREFNAHKKAVNAMDFIGGESYMYSGSDDYQIKLYDIASNEVVRTYVNAHSDYVRSIVSVPNSDRNVISGGYDGFANLFDFRDKSKKPIRQFNHGVSIEDTTIIPSGFSFATVGGTSVNIWDLRTGNAIETLNHNLKTITCAKFISNGDRLITSSIDQSMKIYRTDTYQITHQFKFPSPVLSFDMTQNTKCFAVGMADGVLEIRSNQKKLGEQVDSDEEKDDKEDLGLQIPDFLKYNEAAQRRVHNFQYFSRGMYDKPTQYDVKYEEKRIKKISKYDKLLKKFQYKTAMMHALENRQNDVVIGLYEELIQRGEIINAFKNLDDSQLSIVFEFIAKKIANPKFQDVAIHMLNLMFEQYTYESGKYLESMVDILDEEILTQKLLLQLNGQIDTIVNTSIVE
ncbi:U3 small nucleolar RNA-associated protein, putative (macronuclear) [Tetrahymena thermophila SB210]|uniref:U3 small nucleolar RNA-associated protein, putative n=1 Tax=Tetrahymena thermophila (strain SB210) TaxID=312017 RepID=I7MCW7_TETTS|nr:U3 small nucleolar RNA-associated protein, putative [Tetrahymena thermophila SB210]EAR85061.1 U3 small nucleolar RNA-associated protein, putative [Tetrahymena thermophila SB210]|eukprot:XP_001032724.1 U3 small nucleolar RNA-associated protein, putative [Tetrahymena thermophila SB210]